MAKRKDHGKDNLLDLDGDRYYVDDRGEFEVIFKVSRITVTKERPHGLSYSLLLLNAKGDRVVCFDNAHAVTTHSARYDHKHVRDRVSPYEFMDALTLLHDFWEEVDKCI